MNYVIIGGVAAGMSAAMSIYRTDEQAHITILEQGEIYSYGQCGLPYVISGRVDSVQELIARQVDTFRNKYGMEARTRVEVTEIDEHKQTVGGFDHQAKEQFTVSYDKLLIATGAAPNVPKWSGVDLSGIHTLKTIPDTQAIMKDLENDSQRMVIVGGGYIGLEVAENLVSLGKKVTLIQRGEQLAANFDKDMAALAYDEAIAQGVEVILNESVEALVGDRGRVEEVITDKGRYAADFVLLAIGVHPNTAFLKTSDIHLDAHGAIKVNDYMETNMKNVYAAGDCATAYHRVKGKDDYIPLGTTANKQGSLAGLNMAGKRTPFKGIVGTAIFKFFDLSLGRTGLSEKEAQLCQIPYETQTYKGGHIANYYPGNKTLSIKLIYCKKTNQLLGGQAVGEAGVSKRIDVLATAIYNNMKASDLIDLDLSYAPPFNSVRDPLQQMARRI